MNDDAARARALNDEAVAHFGAGRLAEARDAFERVLALAPGYAAAWQNLAVVRLALGDADGAIAAMKRALEAAPRDAGLWQGFGGLMMRLGRPQDATAAFERAAFLAPGDAEIVLDRGRAALAMGRPVDALQLVDPLGTRPGALSVRARAVAALGERQAALDTWRRLFAAAPCHPGAAAGLLGALLYDGEDAGEIARVARAWGASCAPMSTDAATPRPAPAADRKLRVGYVSGDFCRHSVGWFALPLIEAHDPAAVDVHLYANGGPDDDVARRFRAAVGPRWRAIGGLDAAAAARQVREDAIDVLVDLAGHTDGGRLDLFALKPAPVQVAWLGWAATTGLEQIDARLTDALADPPGAEAESVEAPVRLEGGFHAWRPPADVADLPPAGVPGGGPVFASFNHARKLGRACVALWARVLAAVPGATLWIKSAPLADPGLAARLAADFARQGIARERLRLDGARPPQREHFAAYAGMDVALDPVPYNGTTTTLEALWMGVPVVALAGGDRHAARVGASLLTHAGMAEFLAGDADAYVATAAALAADRARLAARRGELRRRLEASPLMDARGLARRVEAAFRALRRG